MNASENRRVRDRAKAARVKHWQIALYLGVSEQTFMRWLRIPLSQDREHQILEAIDALSGEVS